MENCPACGQPSDYCQGHGDIGDPAGSEILRLHDTGVHNACHPAGCETAAKHLGVTPPPVEEMLIVCLDCGEAFNGRETPVPYMLEHEANDHPGETDVSYGLLPESEAM